MTHDEELLLLVDNIRSNVAVIAIGVIGGVLFTVLLFAVLIK